MSEGIRLLPHYFDAAGPGAALAVVHEDGTVHEECRGWADVEEGRAITPETVFDLASGSKTFTAAAALVLEERGELDRAAPVADYLPDFHAPDVQAPDSGRPVTLRDLLQHTSGLPDYLEAGMYTDPEHATPAYLDAHLPGWSRAARPGEAHLYSNTNYYVLARVLEVVTGRDFATLLREILFLPLGLQQTTVGAPAPGSSVARGYAAAGYGLPLFTPSEEIPLETLGDGGIHSTLRDLVRWQRRLWSGEVVGEEGLRRMSTAGTLDSGQLFPYGHGLQVEKDAAGRAWCGHGGSWTSSTVMIGRYVGERIDVIVLSNEFMAPVERISQRALALLGPQPCELNHAR